MPEKATLAAARKDKRAGKSPTTQAGDFVREEIHHVREGIHQAGDRDRFVEGSTRRRAFAESATQRDNQNQTECGVCEPRWPPPASATLFEKVSRQPAGVEAREPERGFAEGALPSGEELGPTTRRGSAKTSGTSCCADQGAGDA